MVSLISEISIVMNVSIVIIVMILSFSGTHKNVKILIFYLIATIVPTVFDV